ncbi:MAG: ECF-type sigma factor [Planctomycetota bacterium]|nr:ECF-type sigma factor [Planctomycetota bacterium]
MNIDVPHAEPSGAGRADTGDRADRLITLVYNELRALAEQRIRTLGPGVSIQPTELLNEVYLKLGKDPARSFEGRSHFIGAAAIAMRNILVDRARRASAMKRGGDHSRVPLEDLSVAVDRSPDEIVGVDTALSKLEKVDPRSATVVSMRFYLGLGFSEIAFALGVTERTVERDWAFARRWLAQELREARSGA